MALITGSGTPDLPAITAAGYYLAGAASLFTGLTDAQSGETNPEDIPTNSKPHFSFVVEKFAGVPITEVRIQVSAADDHDFSETVHWDSGWVALGTEQITDSDLDTEGKARIPDIIYGGS